MDITMSRCRELAAKLKNVVDPWDIEYASVDELADEIANDPLSTIDYLLDIVSEY